MADLKGIDPDIFKTVSHLQGIVHKKLKVDNDRYSCFMTTRRNISVGSYWSSFCANLFQLFGVFSVFQALLFCLFYVRYSNLVAYLIRTEKPIIVLFHN